jgi:hypothetical protein
MTAADPSQNAETRAVRDDLFDRLVNAYRAEGWSISAAEDAALVALKVLGFDGTVR